MIFLWGLGQGTNNYIDLCSLWQGIQLLKSLKIDRAMVISDSNLIIDKLNRNHDNFQDLTRGMDRIVQEEHYFSQINYFNVLRIHNESADHLANIRVGFRMGQLLVDGDMRMVFPP